MPKTLLSEKEQQEQLLLLQTRFEKHIKRHPHLLWNEIQTRLLSSPEKIWSLYQMEQTGGEPDVIDFDKNTSEFIFVDCAQESPTGRRSLCYDDAAWQARKSNKPKSSAMQVASEMGLTLLTEEEYKNLQTFGEFDTKTSSWIHTPSEVRELGGALFCDRRYNQVFTYHNGAESYYSARGFRGMLRI